MTSELERKMCKILIVEDSDTFRETLRGILYSRFPFLAFDEARDGKEALKKVNSFHPDLIFMDIELPGESGLELTKKIKESYSKIIIIILTNYDLPEYREAARRSGADHFIVKGSSTTQEILAFVESIVSKLRTKPTKQGHG